MAETAAGWTEDTLASTVGGEEGSVTGADGGSGTGSEAGDSSSGQAERVGTELVPAGAWEEGSVEERCEWLARALMGSLVEQRRLQADFDGAGERHDSLCSATAAAEKELQRLHKLNTHLRTMLEGLDGTGVGRLGLWTCASSSAGVVEELRTLRELNKRSDAHARRLQRALEEERRKAKRLEDAGKKNQSSEKPAEGPTGDSPITQAHVPTLHSD